MYFAVLFLVDLNYNLERLIKVEKQKIKEW